MTTRRRRRALRLLSGVVVVGVVVALQSTEWLASLGGRPRGARLERNRRSPEFAAGKFHNPQKTRMMSGSYREMFRRQFFGKERRTPERAIPVVRPDLSTPPASGLRATWLGWSTVLVEIDGKHVLTDPVWSERCSPSTLVGPKRFHAPPIPLDALPHIDVVVVSHDHYDHLDMDVVRALAERGTRFAVPLGVGAHLERWGVPAAQISELDWGETIVIDTLRITATPARHYSGRNPLYNNETLWASWVVKSSAHAVYFSGDTGYTEAFQEIGRTHGPFDLTLIKIGAYDPTWAEIHMTPEEAAQAHRDLRGSVMLPVHWATFNLAFHAWREPADRVVAAAESAHVALVMPRPGQSFEPAHPPAVEAWWR